MRNNRGLSRREFIALASASALAATAGCRNEKPITKRKEASTNELLELSAVDGTGVTFDQLISKASADIRRDFRELLPGGKSFVGEAE
jgi:hypothetical protein